MPCSLRGKFCAKNLMCDSEAMSKIEDNHDEFIRFYFQTNLGRSPEVSDEISRVADLLPMYFNKDLPNTFVSNSSGLKLGSKHHPIGICNDVGDCVSHLS